jgi:VCBS repeat protein
VSSRVGSVLVVFLASLPFLLVSPALAQYMYLDSNGDGIHTAADQVNPAGPTTIEIWLNTAANRDGSPAVCNIDPSLPLSISAYVVGLRSSGGTVTWGSFVNRQPTLTFNFGEHKSSTEYMNGFGGQSPLPPGLYHLATLPLSVASGSPAIDIVPNVAGSSDMTSFGTGAGGCYGNDFDNTLKLGSEWHDVDGLPFGTGGGANQPPILSQPQDMTVLTGALAFQTLTASDPDRQPLSFSKASNTAFMTVTTRDVGDGTATGVIALAPLAGDAGVTTGAVSVSDGFASTQKQFQIQVTAGPNHAPALSGPDAITAVAGTTPRFSLGTFDPDGQPITFEKIDGPDYMQVSTLTSGPGGAVGSVQLTPGLCDAGTATSTIAATDGIVTDSKPLPITVKIPRAAPAQPPPAPANVAATLAVGDLNEDGHADVVAGSSAAGSLSILLGRGDGTFAPTTYQPLTPGGEATSVALGDWNGDGHLDAAAATSSISGDRLYVLLGDGLGGLSPTVSYPAPTPWMVRAGDLDRDGNLDLAVTHGASVGVFLGHGDGTFGPGSDYAMGGVPRGLALADFNRDGRLDMATAGLASDDVRMRLGLGDGTFGDVTVLASMEQAFELIPGDWNRDGKVDLAVTTFDQRTIRIYQGDGNGVFTAGADLSGFVDSPSLATSDLNGDGNDDLIVSGAQIVYGKGDGTFLPTRTLANVPAGGVGLADFNEDGFPDIASAQGNVYLWLNDAGGAGSPEARAFAESAAPAGGKPTTCMRIEPVAGSYRNEDLDLTTLTLSPDGAGGSIHAISTKTAVLRDTDGNGVAEVPACFARDDLAALFSAERGRQTVTAHLQGALVDGRPFCAKVSFDIIGTGQNLAASVSPNPLNPGGILRLTTSRDGFVRVRLFDLQGRVVRVLEDRALVPAGAHDVRIDGRNTSGQTLASGVYFYQVETVEGSLRGRITVLK